MQFDPLDPAYQQDPYPGLASQRQSTPVVRDARLGHWFATRYEDCARLLRDDASFAPDPAQARGPLGEGLRSARARAPLGDAPLLGLSDAPVHDRLRRAANPAFSPAAAEAMRPAIQETVDELLDAFPSGKPFDFMAAFADRLPSLVMLRLLGVPHETRPRMEAWLSAIGQARENGDIREEAIERARHGHAGLEGYAHRLQQSGTGGTNLFAMLLEAHHEGELTLQEVLSVVVHVALVGNGPTAGLLGNGMVALLEHPDEAAHLRDAPERIGGAVHELLRWDSPTHAVPRVARHDVELGGATIPAGDVVFAMVGAANRDPEQFPAPDRLDLDRDARTHLGFGQGTHYCLGAPLARIEAELAFRAILERFPGLRYAEGGPEWSPGFELRVPARLVLRDG